MDRRRRRVCRALAATPLLGVAGCLSTLPGATGPRNPPDEERPTDGGDRALVAVASTDVEESAEGKLLVTGTVRNRSGARVTRTVTAEVTVGDATTTASTDVSVPSRGTAEFSVVVDVAFQRFNEGGSLQVRLN